MDEKGRQKNITYVITGASRGIGLGLVEALVSRPFTTVVATVRNEAAVTALKNHSASLAKGENSALHVLDLDFSSAVSPETIRERFVDATGGGPIVDRVDVLICAAGHVSSVIPSAQITAESLRTHFEINTIGPLMTFQALWPFMDGRRPQERAPSEGDELTIPPKFIALSSSLGSIGAMEPFPAGAYGPSKAALNWIVRSLHLEMEKSGLVSVAVHPGWVKTNMGGIVAEAWGYEKGPPNTVEESVTGILKVVDKADRENFSGKFVSFDGQILPW
jgi:NAD(P)-dependent dehydrogenase (short-subunit alcohol dehydrogenase family)